MPCGPKCFKCMLLMSSGPVLDKFFVFLIMFRVCSVVNGVAVWSSGKVRLCMEVRFSAGVCVGLR